MRVYLSERGWPPKWAVEIPRSRPSATSLAAFTLFTNLGENHQYRHDYSLVTSTSVPVSLLLLLCSSLQHKWSFWLITFIIHVEWSDVGSLNAHEYLWDETLIGPAAGNLSPVEWLCPVSWEWAVMSSWETNRAYVLSAPSAWERSLFKCPWGVTGRTKINLA